MFVTLRTCLIDQLSRQQDSFRDKVSVPELSILLGDKYGVTRAVAFIPYPITLTKSLISRR